MKKTSTTIVDFIKTIEKDFYGKKKGISPEYLICDNPDTIETLQISNDSYCFNYYYRKDKKQFSELLNRIENNKVLNPLLINIKQGTEEVDYTLPHIDNTMYKEKSTSITFQNKQLDYFKSRSIAMGQIFTFIFDGFIIKVLPPLYITNRFDYDKSIYINNLLIYSDAIKGTKEELFWNRISNTHHDKLESPETNAFITDFFIFANLVFLNGDKSEYYSGVLENYLLYSENPYLHTDFYVIEYCYKPNNIIHKYIVKEFSEERAVDRLRQNYKIFNSDIVKVSKWKATKI